jgi:hypothetical protein
MRGKDLETRRARWGEELLRKGSDFSHPHTHTFRDMKTNTCALWQVTSAEGFVKAKLFEILDDLEKKTRPIMEEARKQLMQSKGKEAAEPWNISYALAGGKRLGAGGWGGIRGGCMGRGAGAGGGRGGTRRGDGGAMGGLVVMRFLTLLSPPLALSLRNRRDREGHGSLLPF